jgi:hypothetical protein
MKWILDAAAGASRLDFETTFTEGTMKRLLALSILLLAGLGCRNTLGPAENRSRPGPDPLLSIEEQRKYGRERYSIPEDTTLVPRGFSDRPSPSGR